MIGIFFVLSSRVSARVAWKPFCPGSTTSISTRSGRDCFTITMASSALSAVATLKPFLESTALRNSRSVAESSTISTFLMVMRCLSGFDVFGDCRDEAPFGEGLGEIAVRAREAPARAIEHPILAREHDHWRRLQLRVLLDERAGLVAVEARHHDVDEDEPRLVIGDLRERIEAVFGENHFVARLAEKHLRASPDGVAVVDDQDLDRPWFALHWLRGLAHKTISPETLLLVWILAFSESSLSEIIHHPVQMD